MQYIHTSLRSVLVLKQEANDSAIQNIQEA